MASLFVTTFTLSISLENPQREYYKPYFPILTLPQKFVLSSLKQHGIHVEKHYATWGIRQFLLVYIS